jgi:hypothetical protein
MVPILRIDGVDPFSPMPKREVVRHERQAVRVMRMTPAQLRAKMKGKHLPTFYYQILEDANWHRENALLSKMEVFGPRERHTYKRQVWYAPKLYSSSEGQYQRYKKGGGRTWELPI